VGIAEAKADSAFDLITGGSDDMSEKQFCDAYTHFWLDQTPSDYMHFYGTVSAWEELRSPIGKDKEEEVQALDGDAVEIKSVGIDSTVVTVE